MLGQNDGALADFARAIEFAPTRSGAAARPRPGAARRQSAADGAAAISRTRWRPTTASRSPTAVAPRRDSRRSAPTEAIEDLSRAIAFDPTNADIYVERGHWPTCMSDNTPAALKDFERAVEVDPKSAAALEARSLAYVKVNAHNEAEADITRVLELNPRAGGG